MKLGLGLGVNSITSQKIGGAGQNLLLGSEELNKAQDGQWIQRLISSVTADDEVAPIGGETTAESVAFTADKQSRIEQLVTLVAGTEYTFSVWAKATGGSPQSFRLSYRDNTIGSGARETETAPTSWDANTGRATMTFTAASSGTYWMRIQNASAGAAQSIYFWGAMLNEGATAGDYIKTTFSSGPGPSNPPTPPMEFGDNFAGVTAYYSLRRFTTGEDNNAIRVRKEVSSVDEEQDIGFDANGDLDTTALLSFASDADGGNVYVSIWYDQTGNGNDATNSTESEQPIIVSGGTLVEENSKAAIEFDGTDDKLGFASNLNIGGSPSIIGVLKSPAGDIAWRGGGSDYWYFAASNSFRVRIGDFDTYFNNEDGVQDITDSQKLIATYKNSTNVELTVDGASKGTESSGTGADGYFNNIGSDLAGYVIDGVWQELIIYTSDQSTNRGTITPFGGTGIEGNINNYFDIA